MVHAVKHRSHSQTVKTETALLITLFCGEQKDCVVIAAVWTLEPYCEALVVSPGSGSSDGKESSPKAEPHNKKAVASTSTIKKSSVGLAHPVGVK